MRKIFSLLFAAFIAVTASATTAADTIDTKTAKRTARELKDTDKNLINAALKGWKLKIGAGFNIGGASPLPLPKEIRKIESFNPLLNVMLEADVHKKFGKSRWGVMLGARFEMKGMETDAQVKGYRLSAHEADGAEVKGVWTGGVKTKLKNSYVTVPVLATCQINQRWRVGAGPYFSYLLDGEFKGEAHHGYIRDTDPTGPKTEMESATYDYSSALRKFHWGVQAGAEWNAYKHLVVTAYLQWGINGIFPHDFEDVSFALYPIYGTVGFAYEF